MSERALATVEVVQEVRPIPGADAIEVVRIRNWWIVVKKDEGYEVGRRCVYFEVDSALPVEDPRFAFLAARSTKTMPSGSPVHVLSTARLKGQVSQGLVLPLSDFPELDGLPDDFTGDVTELLGIVKYDPPLPMSTGGEIAGRFPTSYVSKTDSGRIQNFSPEDWADITAVIRDPFGVYYGWEWRATEKIDGTSATFIQGEAGLVVCSRNYQIRDGDNVYWSMVDKYKLNEIIPFGCYVQGEIYGNGINGNRLRLPDVRFAAFKAGMWSQRSSYAFARAGEHDESWVGRLPVVPSLDLQLALSIEDNIAMVDGMKSTIAPDRLAEGVVWRLHDFSSDGYERCPPVPTFKVISNAYLLKNKD